MDKGTLHALCVKYHCRVVLYPTPAVRGITVPEDAGYLIIIDPRLSESRQLRTLWHELLHVILGHFAERSHLTDAEREHEVNSLIGEK